MSLFIFGFACGFGVGAVVMKHWDWIVSKTTSLKK